MRKVLQYPLLLLWLVGLAGPQILLECHAFVPVSFHPGVISLSVGPSLWRQLTHRKHKSTERSAVASYLGVIPPVSPKEETSYNDINDSSSKSLARAQQLLSILTSDILTPVGLAIARDGVPTDWDRFWETQVRPGSGDGMTLGAQVTLALEKMGPTYVKFGQALSSRSDIVPRSLALALSTLQDQMQPFDTKLAKNILREELSEKFATQQELESFLSSISETPVAAASIGQVYSGQLPNGGQKVAIKVQRPGIRDLVDEDATLLRSMVDVVESIPAIPKLQKDQERFISTDLSGAVDEFMSRIVEELDYRNEATNIALFSSLYSHRRTMDKGRGDSTRSKIQVVVPDVYMDLCTDNVLVMEWIDGTKLVDLHSNEYSREALIIIEQGIDCTLSQLLDTGILHADPHGGNLLKVAETTKSGESIERLGYVDFGLLSSVPQTVRDGLICAVTQLVFARNVTAVANLFGELALIPDDILSSPQEMEALSRELDSALSDVLDYNTKSSSGSMTSTTIPTLRFDKLLDTLSRLVPRFRFQLPPYFLNNARALSTLEGMAREVDPSFNVLQSLYPYALKRLLSNPSESPVVEATLQSLIRNPVTRRVDRSRVQKLIDDSVILTGYPRTRVLRDILLSKNGPRLARTILFDQMSQLFRGGRITKMARYFKL